MLQHKDRHAHELHTPRLNLLRFSSSFYPHLRELSQVEVSSYINATVPFNRDTNVAEWYTRTATSVFSARYVDVLSV
jgi:hypothetical protein